MTNHHILNLHETGSFDDSITGIQHHIYNPYTTAFNNNDEIRIAIQQQDLYVLPHDSYIYVEGAIEKEAGSNNPMPSFVNNGIAFLFDEIRYEINGFMIDKCKNVGITSTMKGLISHRPDDMHSLAISCWNTGPYINLIDKKTFNYCIPLKHLLGFIEDYRNIVMNVKHELVLIRSRTDVNSLIGTHDNCKIKLLKVQWRMPHVNVSDAEKLKLLRVIERKQTIPMHFRSWELYEYPTLPQTDRQVWTVKTSTQLNTPRFIILGFQTDRNNLIHKDKSNFDYCTFNDIKVYLNSECYPYESLDINFPENRYAVLYDMYSRFQKSYYHDRDDKIAAPLLKFDSFKDKAPLIVIDCAHQNEVLKKSVIDIRMVIQMKENIPANTSAFCLIIHDNLVTYNPYTNIVNRAF